MKADSFSQCNEGGFPPSHADGSGCPGAELELYLEGELLDARATEDVRSHLAACLRCRLRADGYDALTRRILELAVRGPGEPRECDVGVRRRVDRILQAVGEVREAAHARGAPDWGVRTDGALPPKTERVGRSWKLRAAALLVFGALLGFLASQLASGPNAPVRVATQSPSASLVVGEPRIRGAEAAEVVWFAHWGPPKATSEADGSRIDGRRGDVRLLGFPSPDSGEPAWDAPGASGLRWVVEALRRRPHAPRALARYYLIPEPVKTSEPAIGAWRAGPTAGQILRADRNARAERLGEWTAQRGDPGVERGVEIVPVSWVHLSESEPGPRVLWDDEMPPRRVRIWVVPQPAPSYVVEGSFEGGDGVLWIRERDPDAVRWPLSAVPR